MGEVTEAALPDIARSPNESILSADRPCIAVLPFASLGDGADARYLSDGITEDIITELSRFREILVIARVTGTTLRPPQATAQLTDRIAIGSRQPTTQDATESLHARLAWAWFRHRQY